MRGGENRMRHWAIIVLAILLPAFSLSAQEIRTEAPDEVLENEAFQIDYEVISADPIEEMPSLVAAKDFDLLGEPQLKKTYPSQFWGDKYYTLRITCTFKAKKKGKLNLPRIELVSDGQKLTSQKRNIFVRELPEMGNVQCFVEVSASKSSVNVGDTLTVSYKLYSTKEVSNILRLEIPGLRNFQYQDLSPRRITFTEEKVDGIDYKVYEIRRYVLRSTQLGRHTLGEGLVELEYTYPTGRERVDGWGRRFEEQLRETKKCTIGEISVLVHDMIAI